MTEMEQLEKRVLLLEQHRFELTEEQLNGLADRAAEKALEKVYANVGRGVLQKFLWLIGVVVLSAAMYFAGKGALVIK